MSSSALVITPIFRITSYNVCYTKLLRLERADLLAALATLPGLYVPSLYRVAYHADGTLREMVPSTDAPTQVRRQWLAQLDDFQARTCLVTADTEFSNMQLVEVSRGCPRGCRSYNFV